MKMKAAAVVSVLACAGTTSAQSDVTLYGVVGVNIEYVDNVSRVPPGTAGFPGPAGNKFALTSGGLSGSRWGLRAVEDLGGGTKALYVLESGFGLDDGKLQQGGRLFGRQAYVGNGAHALSGVGAPVTLLASMLRALPA